MRVLHIDTGAEMRGGQHQVLLLSRELRTAQIHSVLLARKGSPLWQAASSDGFDVAPAGMWQMWQHSKQADIVHAHDARGHTIAALASNRRFVVSRRVAFPVRRSIFSAWKYGRAARFLAVSNFVANELEAAGISKRKIDVVYDAVWGEETAATWDARSPAVALASTDPQKGRDLIEHAAQISGMAVKFSDNLAADLRHASMFVYITRSEGLGSAALLAMSMGVPVVASRVGGLAEVFVDGVSGIFVENDPQAIAAAMRRVRDEPATLIEQGRARVAECFTKEHLLRATLASYERALGS